MERIGCNRWKINRVHGTNAHLLGILAPHMQTPAHCVLRLGIVLEMLRGPGGATPGKSCSTNGVGALQLML